jgi:hypothetical protein
MLAYRIAIRSDGASPEPLSVVLHAPDGKVIRQSAMNSAHARRVASSMAMLVQRHDPHGQIILDTSVPA